MYNGIVALGEVHARFTLCVDCLNVTFLLKVNQNGSTPPCDGIISVRVLAAGIISVRVLAAGIISVRVNCEYDTQVKWRIAKRSKPDYWKCVYDVLSLICPFDLPVMACLWS